MAKLIHLKILPAAISLLSLILFTSFTSPDSVSLFFLVVPLLLIFLTIYFASLVIVSAIRNDSVWPGSNRLMAIVLAGSVTVLVIFKSIGQLTARDLLLWMILNSCLIFYIHKFRLRY